MTRRPGREFGVGHAVKEFEVLGIPFRQRGRMTDEALAVMQVHVGMGPLSGRPSPALREEALERLRVLAENGVNTTSVPMLGAASVEEFLDALRWFSEEVVAAAR